MKYGKEKGTGWNLDNSYIRLPESLYKKTEPTPVLSPELIVANGPLAEYLGLNPDTLNHDENIAVFAGNRIPEGAVPIAQAYAGHQFGYFTMLGDGRAVLIGEQITPQGERFDIQLKGSGRTPYSRRGDGRATLGPMLREYIISEGMYNLGIPTTRSLAVVTTGETVFRDKDDTGSILTRVAASHIRVGTFEYTSKWAHIDELRSLADYTIKRHYPEADGEENPYLALLRGVAKRQAALIAKWQMVGFIHGVMNTDNMALSGETIDYGPCAFMDTYDPATVFSSIDREGRYAYGNQPYIAGWNLARFAETLLPLLHENQEQAVKLAQKEVQDFHQRYRCHYLGGMRAKLGLFDAEPGDISLIEGLLNLMKKHHADFTNTFRALTLDSTGNSELFESSEFIDWHRAWQERLNRQKKMETSPYQLMQKNNPAVIPRNHRVEEALDAAVKQCDLTVMNRLLKALSNPYAYTPDQDEYTQLPDPSDRPYRTFCGT